MKTNIKFGAKTYRIEISEIEGGPLKVKVNEKNYFFSKNEFGELISIDPFSEDFKAKVKESEVFLEALVEKEIKAPISGIISSIEVKKGAYVKPGQKVVTLMAMKMENEIIAETSGIVAKVEVRPGQFVNTGQTLILLE